MKACAENNCQQQLSIGVLKPYCPEIFREASGLIGFRLEAKRTVYNLCWVLIVVLTVF